MKPDSGFNTFEMFYEGSAKPHERCCQDLVGSLTGGREISVTATALALESRHGGQSIDQATLAAIALSLPD